MNNNTQSTYIQDNINNIYINSRRLRFRRLDKSRAWAVGGHAVRSCFKHAKGEIVSVIKKDGKARFRGLIRCGSIWDCPVCATKIAIGRRKELERGLANFYSDYTQGSVVMVTYTIRHKICHKLVDLQSALANAVAFVKSGSPWLRMKKKLGLLGTITATEITRSEFSGWHIHKHELMIFNKEVSEKELSNLLIFIKNRYKYKLQDYGYEILDHIGVVLTQAEKEKTIENYVSKWGLDAELCSQNKTGGSKPFELLDRNDPEAKILWQEYSAAMKGKRWLVFSKGLRNLLGLVGELEDSQIANEEESESINKIDYELRVDIPLEVWKLVVKNNLQCRVLEIVEEGKEEVEIFSNLLTLVYSSG